MPPRAIRPSSPFKSFSDLGICGLMAFVSGTEWHAIVGGRHQNRVCEDVRSRVEGVLVPPVCHAYRVLLFIVLSSVLRMEAKKARTCRNLQVRASHQPFRASSKLWGLRNPSLRLRCSRPCR